MLNSGEIGPLEKQDVPEKAAMPLPLLPPHPDPILSHAAVLCTLMIVRTLTSSASYIEEAIRLEPIAS